MKVLLLQDLKGVGRRMEIKEVKDGFARNFLLPQKLAAPVNQEALALKARFEAEEKAALARYAELADKLTKTVLEFQAKADDKGRIFGSVKAADIKAKLLERGFGETEVVLGKPLKEIGEHTAEVHFSRGAKGKVKIILRSSP